MNALNRDVGERNAHIATFSSSAYHTVIDEQIVFNRLNYKLSAVWSLLRASGYLRVERYSMNMECGREEYDLKLTNREVRIMFEQMTEDWFREYTGTD